MSNIDTRFWIELECTFSNFSEFTESEDFKLIGDILKKYSIQATINSEIKPLEKQTYDVRKLS